jgi:hypothetical protein
MDSRSYEIGDVGEDARVQQGDGNVWIERLVIVGEASPDAAALLQRGVRQLEARSYRMAAETLTKAVDADPSLRGGYYYLSLARLHGRRPKQLTRDEVDEIDGLLSMAIGMNGRDALFLWFRALLRDDYYHGNRLICPPPSVEQVIRDALAGYTDRGELGGLLQRVPATTSPVYAELARLAGGRP